MKHRIPGLTFVVLAALAPAACKEDCQVQLADVSNPFLEAQQSCWRIRADNGQCDDQGHAPICEGTTLSCPAGQVLGKDCPDGRFNRPDAGR
jgi:hypothetical protein